MPVASRPQSASNCAGSPCSTKWSGRPSCSTGASTPWAALQRAVADYGHCDKGNTAPIVTEALLRVIISGWPNIANAGPILAKDAAFKDWLGRRLSSPDLDTRDTAEIVNLAKGSCPKGQDAVCAEILSSAELGRAISAPDLMLLAPPPSPAPAKKP